MDTVWRATEGHPDCDYAGYWASGGNQLCTIYIAVECDQVDPMCAFKVQVQLYESAADGGEIVTRRPARYIPKDQDYVDVRVPYKALARFYYPIDVD